MGFTAAFEPDKPTTTLTAAETDRGVQITGSHNPPDHNGVKLTLGQRLQSSARTSRRRAGGPRPARSPKATERARPAT